MESFDFGSRDGAWAILAGRRGQLGICRLLGLNLNGGQEGGVTLVSSVCSVAPLLQSLPCIVYRTRAQWVPMQDLAGPISENIFPDYWSRGFLDTPG